MDKHLFFSKLKCYSSSCCSYTLLDLERTVRSDLIYRPRSVAPPNWMLERHGHININIQAGSLQFVGAFERANTAF
jgi:hypothetical protein